MLLSSNRFSGLKTTTIINDLRDLEKLYYFSFNGVRYYHKLTELENIKQINTKYKKYQIIFPSATCSCNNFTNTDLIINNFCIHLQKKILTIFKDKLVDLSYLLLKDFVPNTISYKIELEKEYFIILSIYPQVKYVKIYFINNKNIFQVIKYYPLKKQFQYGINLNLNKNKNDFIEEVLNNIEIK